MTGKRFILRAAPALGSELGEYAENMERKF